jgi:hypothetical protein
MPAPLSDGAGETRPTMKQKPKAPAAAREWLAEIGRLGGKSRSPAKVAASVRNAKKGGWPKGRPRKKS